MDVNIEASVSFDPILANIEFEKLLKWYKIKVYKWSKSNCGLAYSHNRTIKVPKPTDHIKFGICMHEIAHIRMGKPSNNIYIDEYKCEQFALAQLEKLGFDTEEYRETARRHIIRRIAKGYRRKLKIDSIPQEIKDFCNIDFESWKGNNVFVYVEKIEKGSRSLANTNLIIQKKPI